MTNDEFIIFARRLFVSFPTLSEWLNATSPDPSATQEIWRETLRPYTLAECLGIVDDWNTGKSQPFAAYDRDKVHLIIRAMIGFQRDKQRKRNEVANRSKEYESLPNTPYTDATMVSVFKKLSSLYGKLQRGDITQAEYDSVHADEFAKL